MIMQSKIPCFQKINTCTFVFFLFTYCLNVFQCLLVQGYWAKASWGFPKGKVNEDEIDYMCAIREVCVKYLYEK